MKNTNVLSSERAIGYHINRVIQGRDMTLEQIANSAKIPAMRFCAIIKGSTAIQDEELKAIADSLEIDVQELQQPLPDEELYSYNLHCMGTASDPDGLNKVLDKIDMYVRLLNFGSND